MRAASLALLTLATPVAFGQDASPDASPVQMSVVVRQHATGAQVVEVTALRPGYPRALLAEQCARIAANAGSDLRGLALHEDEFRKGDPKSRFVKGSFGMTGLIDTVNGTLNLQAIARAFAGAPEQYRIDRLIVSFAEFKPTDANLREFQSPAVKVAGTYLEDPSGLEYRIVLNSQKPEEIEIPDRYSPKESTLPPAPTSTPTDSMRIVWIVAGAILAGLLVYFVAVKLGR